MSTDDTVVFHVRTHVEDRPVVGVDSMVVEVPAGVYVPVDAGPPTVHVPALGRLLRQLCDYGAANVGEALHHADWVITGSAETVEEWGMHGQPDCSRCRAGVDQAIAHLAERGGELLVGKLYWAGTS